MNIKQALLLIVLISLSSMTLHAANEACWKSYRTTLVNDSGLPLEVTILDSAPKNNETNISVPKGKNEFFDLEPEFSVTEIKAETINRKGVPVEAALDMSTLNAATRKVKISEKKINLL